MHVLVIAGFLALAGAQSTIDPNLLISIFGTSPTAAPTPTPPTRKPLEEVYRNTSLAKFDSSTIKSSVLIDVFGTPPTSSTPKSLNAERSSGVSQGTRFVNVEGLPTIEPSLLIDVFGTLPTNPTRRPREADNSRGVSQGMSFPKVDSSTIKASVLINVFGTPPTSLTPKSHDAESSSGVSQGTRLVNVEGLPTIEPSLLIDIFGVPPTNTTPRPSEAENPRRVYEGMSFPKVDSSTIKSSVLIDVFGTPPASSTPKSHDTESPSGVSQGTRSVKAERLPTIEASLLIDIFGTPPTSLPSKPHESGSSRGVTEGTKLVNVEGLSTTNSSKQRNEDITVKPTEGTSIYVDRDGQNCQCVPYYLCDANNVGVDVNNATVTGWGILDIRFGEDDDDTRQCQESVEVCCVIPKDTSELPIPAKPQPQPDPAKVKGCGYRNPQGLGGITVTGGSGAESQFGEFPWVVALLDNRNSSYAGVGVLIHPQVVMTGAHIAQKYGPGNLKIRAGEWDTQTPKEIYPYVERNVQTTVIHQNFMPKSLKNDIALLLLDSPLEITEHINVICMPDQEEVFDSSKNCVANGWGKTHFGQKNVYAVILKKVEVDMVPYSRCNTLLKRTRLGSNFRLHESFVCAGGEAGKDTCQGDGGAPLACPIGNNRYKLTGLVAWGIGCGQKDVPAVYTNVPLFRQWVDDRMAEWGLEATSYRISK